MIEPDIESEEFDQEAYSEVMNHICHELGSIWEYLLNKYEVPDEYLITAFLDHAFDVAIQESGSSLGAIVGFQRAIAALSEDSMEREMRVFKMRVN